MGGITFKRDFLKVAYLPMIGTTLMCILLGWDGIYSRIDGLILFGSFIGYLFFLYKREQHHHLGRIEKKKDVQPLRDTFIALIAIAFMLGSAHLMLSSAQEIVLLTGLGGSLIGVISLGVASASPELFTAVFGVKQRAPGAALGTLIGSNITNPLVAIGGGAIISTYWVPKALVLWDLPMETITAALLLVYLLKVKGKLGKGGAIYLIGLYFFYLAIRIVFFAVD